jgi:hypothetical protein
LYYRLLIAALCVCWALAGESLAYTQKQCGPKPCVEGRETGARCGPYGCQNYSGTGEASWIVVIGDVQVEYEDGGYHLNHVFQDTIGFLHDHRDRIAGVLLVGDQQGGGGSDGSAGDPNDQVATADDILDEAFFQDYFLNKVLDLQIPVVAAKGNHDRLGSFQLSWNPAYVTRMEAVPTVIDAELSPLKEDHMVVAVNNFLGGQLLMFGMADGAWRDDYAGCDPNGFPCDNTASALEFWNVGDDANWVNEWLDAYPDAYAVMAMHGETSIPTFVTDDSQFVLFAAGHFSNKDDAEVDTGGLHDVIEVNHNTQWYASNGLREVTIVRFDPVSGEAISEQIDTHGRTVRDLVSWDGPVSGYKDGSATLAYTHIGAAGQEANPPTVVSATPPSSGGYLDDDSCLYAYFLGDISNHNGCSADPNFHLTWGPEERDGFRTRSWDVPRGSPNNTVVGGGERKIDLGVVPSTSLNQSFDLFVKDTVNPATWSPQDLAVSDFMICQWLQSKYRTLADFETQRVALGISDITHTVHWGTEIRHYCDSNNDPPYCVYVAGDAYIHVYGWPYDGLWHHECFAWGSSDPNAGGTGGDVLLWRDGQLIPADVNVNSTNALADPNVDFELLDGSVEGWHGWWMENVFLDLSLTEADELADLTAIANYIRLCGVADNATSAYRSAAYGGSADVLGPGGETSCSN